MSQKTKDITLPSGAKCRVRAWTVFDRARKGTLPGKLATPNAAPPEGGTPNKEAADWLTGIGFLRDMLLHCCGALQMPDGTSQRIVDKPWDCLGPGETCPELLDKPDAEAIGNAVSELTNGIYAAPGAAVTTFPVAGEPAAAGSAGAAVSPPAV
jgi:hypothetical protein